MKPYKWSLKSDWEPSFIDNFKEILNPQIEDHNWKVFSSPSAFLKVSAFMFICQLTDLNFFFIKYVLWLQPTNIFCALRTWAMCFAAIPAANEYYSYMTDK